MRSLTPAAALLALACTTLAQQQPFSLPSIQDRISFTSTSPSPAPATFSGQKVVRFTTHSAEQHKQLIEKAHRWELDVWAAHMGETCGKDAYGCVDVRLTHGGHNQDPTPRDGLSQEKLIQGLLDGMEGEEKPKSMTMIDDLEEIIQSQRRTKVKQVGQVEEMSKGNTWHKDYHTYDEITEYIKMLQRAYPTHVQLVEIGKTHEGRAILGLKIGDHLPIQPPPQPPTDPEPEPEPEPEPQPPSDPPTNITTPSNNKVGIVITAGQHAREWISTSTSLFFASDLLSVAFGPPHSNITLTPTKKKGRKGKKGKGRKARKTWTKSSARAILSHFTITIIPVSNPDGYVYSWEKNRMWRKNRQPNHFPSGLFCKGVDLNRNYDFAFSRSSSACSEMYPGSSAFSASETRAIAQYLQAEENNIKAYFDLHSYGQLLMYPYSFNCQEPVADEEDLLELSLGAVAALRRVHGEKFNTGKICSVYATSGGNSVDWAYASTKKLDQGDRGEQRGKSKIKWSFGVELRDGGTYGFLLPKEQIVPAGEEATAALAYMLEFIAKKDSHLR